VVEVSWFKLAMVGVGVIESIRLTLAFVIFTLWGAGGKSLLTASLIEFEAV
jgi:hypothetical protein